MVVTKGIALPVFWPRRVLWNDIESEFDNRRQLFAGVLLYETHWVIELEPFNPMR
jgi:hypothetical protein